MEADEESLTTAYLGDQKDREAHVSSRGGDRMAYPQVLCVDDTEIHRAVFLGYPKGDGQGYADDREIHMDRDDEAPGRCEAALHLASWRRVGQDQEVSRRAEKIRYQGLGGDQGFRKVDLARDHRATSESDSGGCKVSGENDKVGVEVPHRSPAKVYGGGGEIFLVGHHSDCRMGLGHRHRSGS